MIAIRANRVTRFNAPAEVTKVIQTYIDDFEMSIKRQEMKLGVDYYRSKNTEIMNRRKMIYVEDDNGNPSEMDDPYKANNKLASGYFKLLVDQKISYLLGNAITIEGDDQDELSDTLPTMWQKKVNEVAKEASKKSRGFAQVYIGEDGKLGIKQIPSEQIIPVYQPHNREELELVIRYYEVTVLDEDGQSAQVNRVEVWDDETVAYYQEQTSDGLYKLLDQEEMMSIFGQPYQNPKYHFQKNLRFGEKIAESEGHSWGRVPFVPLYNNDEEDYDLAPIKSYIDAYDIISSDFINNLDDLQDIFWVLKGYNGQNVSEFIREVKRYKAMKVSDDGDARAETIDIPHEAREKALKIIEDNIFVFGQGVNPNKIGDGNITNVVIKSRYAMLDLKCDMFEDEVEEFLRSIIRFANRYREINNQQPIEISKINFNRAMMVNEIELLEANTKQRGHISQETADSNHPWIDNHSVEEERRERDVGDYVDLDRVNEIEDRIREIVISQMKIEEKEGGE